MSRVPLSPLLVRALHDIFHRTWGGPEHKLDLRKESPVWAAQAEWLHEVATQAAAVARENAHNEFCPMRHVCTVHTFKAEEWRRRAWTEPGSRETG